MVRFRTSPDDPSVMVASSAWTLVLEAVRRNRSARRLHRSRYTYTYIITRAEASLKVAEKGGEGGEEQRVVRGRARKSSQGPPRNFLGVCQTFSGRVFKTFLTSAKHLGRTLKHFSTSAKHLGQTFKHFRPLQNIFGGLSNIFDLCKTFWADFKTF